MVFYTTATPSLGVQSSFVSIERLSWQNPSKNCLLCLSSQSTNPNVDVTSRHKLSTFLSEFVKTRSKLSCFLVVFQSLFRWHGGVNAVWGVWVRMFGDVFCWRANQFVATFSSTCLRWCHTLKRRRESMKKVQWSSMHRVRVCGVNMNDFQIQHDWLWDDIDN